MDLIYLIWGGSFYLSNKILLAIAEGKSKKNKRLLKLMGWWIYILGVPAWVIILVSKQNWIAASIEAGGVPSMLLGLYSVYKNSKVTPKRLGACPRIRTEAKIQKFEGRFWLICILIALGGKKEPKYEPNSWVYSRSFILGQAPMTNKHEMTHPAMNRLIT